MNVMTPRAHPALSLAPVFLLLGGSVFFSGCVSPKYKMAPENARPPRLLNLAAAQPPLGVVLNIFRQAQAHALDTLGISPKEQGL